MTSIDEVIPSQVYLANLAAAQCPTTKRKFGITHLVSVCPDYPSHGPTHLAIPINDCEYDDLLIHLPGACTFIEQALASGGRVLVHCVMGISRSTTVLAAYLMKTRRLSPSAAVAFIRKTRPCVQPNYSFLKQLDAFEACGYAPTAMHPAYRAWKRKYKQEAEKFLNYFLDTAVIIPKCLFLTSEYPSDPLQAELLLYELDVTHFLTIGPSEAQVPTPATVKHQHVAASPGVIDPSACAWIRDTLAGGGRVLVHSLLEARACGIVGAYLMTERGISVDAATKVIQNALPLFDPSPKFTRALEAFALSSASPTRPSLQSTPSSKSITPVNADFVVQTAASLVTDSVRALSDALVAIQIPISKPKSVLGEAPLAASPPVSACSS
ncbi:Phosphatases II [Mycena kentingensis (nom. inval.)]|nr:Phosphatases II [Mycena kentingensis (nom. inval.)]